MAYVPNRSGVVTPLGKSSRAWTAFPLKLWTHKKNSAYCINRQEAGQAMARVRLRAGGWRARSCEFTPFVEVGSVRGCAYCSVQRARILIGAALRNHSIGSGGALARAVSHE